MTFPLPLATPDQFDPAPFVGVGQVLAEEATQAVHDQGRLVAVLTAAHQERGSSPNLEWEAFRTELKKHPAVILEATEVIPPDTGEVVNGCSSVARLLEFRYC